MAAMARWIKLVRLMAGMAFLMLIYMGFAFGNLAGEVPQRNMIQGIDATPFFYSEADGISEQGRELREVVASSKEEQKPGEDTECARGEKDAREV